MTFIRRILTLLILMTAVAANHHARATETDAQSRDFTVVKLDPKSPPAFQIAVHACQGLKNRKLGGSVYLQMDSSDSQWLDDLGLKPTNTVDSSEFLNACIAEFPSCVRYSYKEQQQLLPSIITAAAALGAVPIDTAMSATCPTVAFDATTELKDRATPLLATKYVFEKFITQTTGLAMINPGYDNSPKDFANPAITRNINSHLVDFVFSQKLFTVFLVNGCISGNPENTVLRDIVNSGTWPTPLGVYGYNDSWGTAGYLYEAQTRCLDSRNMGAIPTSTGNLSFFSTRRTPITDPSELKRNAPENIEYDPSLTYIAFVVGDGDNVNYIMHSRKDWLNQRLAACKRDPKTCAPLTWSISPHLPRLAPDVLKWYYASSSQTGNDYFILPPSGHLYSYPSSLGDEDQERFASATEQDARILGISTTIHWDWFETWKVAEKKFLPKYAHQGGAIQGIFPVNVPYMFEAFPTWPKTRFYKVLTGKDGGKAVLFRPREWRGVDGKGPRAGDEPFHLTPADMAKEFASYPPGTVTWVYMTSDGGLSLENSFMELVKILPPNVRIVSTATAAKLALVADQQRN